MLTTIVSFFGGWQIKIAIVLLVVGSLFAWHKIVVHKAVNDAVFAIEQEQAREIFKLKNRANEATIVLRNETDKNAKAKDEKIKSLNTKYDIMVNSLSDRPSRPSTSDLPGNPSTSESSTGATGMSLYRTDAGVLAGFARDASRLQAELKYCYVQYDSVKESLDKFKKENSQRP